MWANGGQNTLIGLYIGLLCEIQQVRNVDTPTFTSRPIAHRSSKRP